MIKAVTSTSRKRGGRLAWEAAAFSAALFLQTYAPSIGSAQSICTEEACPSAFDAIQEKPLQKVPTVFKFQSRISQARLPVGDAKLATVIVFLKRSTGETLCRETLENVMVRDSVVNIDIGRGMNCQMDDVIGNNNDLSFQICIGGEENCLKPVALGTVPQAVKASFAAQAQESYKAQIAGQSHYTHRITPEADLFLTNTVSKGYYDFQTPSAVTARSGSFNSSAQNFAGGYMQWTPVLGSDNELHVCSAVKSGASRTLTDLSSFNIHAGNTRALGSLTTEQAVTVRGGGADVTGGVVVRPTPNTSMTALTVTAGGASVAGGLAVSGGATVQGGLGVTGNAVFNGSVDVAQGAVIGNGITASGSAVFNGQTRFNQQVTFAVPPVFEGSAGTPPIATDSINSTHVVDQSLTGWDLVPWASITSGQLVDVKSDKLGLERFTQTGSEYPTAGLYAIEGAAGCPFWKRPLGGTCRVQYQLYGNMWIGYHPGNSIPFVKADDFIDQYDSFYQCLYSRVHPLIPDVTKVRVETTVVCINR